MANKLLTTVILAISLPMVAIVAYITLGYWIYSSRGASVSIDMVPTVLDASVCGIQQSDVYITWEKLEANVTRVAIVEIFGSDSRPTPHSRYVESIGSLPEGSQLLNYTFYSVALSKSLAPFKIKVSLCNEEDHKENPNTCDVIASTTSGDVTVDRDNMYPRTPVPKTLTTKIYANEHCGYSRSIVVSLDDGPATELNATRKILDLMRAEHPDVKLSFFVSPLSYGEYSMEERCKLIQDIIKDGHEVQSHSWTHKNFTREYNGNFDGMLDELDHVKSWIQCCAGSNYNVTIFRPPFGELSVPLGRLATHLGYSLAYWNSDLFDYTYFDGGDPVGSAGSLQAMLSAIEATLPSADSYQDVLLLGHDRNIHQRNAITQVVSMLKSRLPNHKFVNGEQCWQSCLAYSNGTGFCNDAYLYPATERFANFLATV